MRGNCEDRDVLEFSPSCESVWQFIFVWKGIGWVVDFLRPSGIVVLGIKLHLKPNIGINNLKIGRLRKSK